jgi:hypothetical protein
MVYATPSARCASVDGFRKTFHSKTRGWVGWRGICRGSRSVGERVADGYRSARGDRYSDPTAVDVDDRAVDELRFVGGEIHRACAIASGVPNAPYGVRSSGPHNCCKARHELHLRLPHPPPAPPETPTPTRSADSTSAVLPTPGSPLTTNYPALPTPHRPKQPLQRLALAAPAVQHLRRPLDDHATPPIPRPNAARWTGNDDRAGAMRGAPLRALDGLPWFLPVFPGRPAIREGERGRGTPSWPVDHG